MGNTSWTWVGCHLAISQSSLGLINQRHDSGHLCGCQKPERLEQRWWGGFPWRWGLVRSILWLLDIQDFASDCISLRLAKSWILWPLLPRVFVFFDVESRCNVYASKPSQGMNLVSFWPLRWRWRRVWQPTSGSTNAMQTQVKLFWWDLIHPVRSDPATSSS